ncbi:hypothetical protein NDU88_000850 [Pleurodeles waltl]|uniref:Uncharacterized protein n=1 Tax=Pleurodeles waltl TaxID=8319 RepID=A0AAV7U5E0_PLEWA|nr:hypothetical protein NDU88_000850 [Pleurodeles waltl]
MKASRSLARRCKFRHAGLLADSEQKVNSSGLRSVNASADGLGGRASQQDGQRSSQNNSGLGQRPLTGVHPVDSDVDSKACGKGMLINSMA